MSMFDTAIKMCEDCGSSERELSWSRDGNTKICAFCREKRGSREVGAPTDRALDSAMMEQSLRGSREKG